MMTGRSTECGPTRSQNHGRLKSQRRKKLKCYSCGMRWDLKECWNNKKNKHKSSEASNSQGCVANTSDDGEIMEIYKQQLILKVEDISMKSV